MIPTEYKRTGYVRYCYPMLGSIIMLLALMQLTPLSTYMFHGARGPLIILYCESRETPNYFNLSSANLSPTLGLRTVPKSLITNICEGVNFKELQYLTKPNQVRRWIDANNPHKDSIIMFSDSDIIFNSRYEDLYETIKDVLGNYQMVFSAESNLWMGIGMKGKSDCSTLNQRYYPELNPNLGFCPSHLNSGGYAAKPEFLKKFLDEWLDMASCKHCSWNREESTDIHRSRGSDQGLATILKTRYVNEITLDYHQRIVGSIVSAGPLADGAKNQQKRCCASGDCDYDYSPNQLKDWSLKEEDRSGLKLWTRSDTQFAEDCQLAPIPAVIHLPGPAKDGYRKYMRQQGHAYWNQEIKNPLIRQKY